MWLELVLYYEYCFVWVPEMNSTALGSSRELRLVETLEEVCRGMLDYRIHKERQDSTRWAKKMSQTFQTLHNLV